MIRTIPDDILTRQAEPITGDSTDDDLLALDRKLLAEWDDGVAGIAAPQIGESVRAVAVKLSFNAWPITLINPVIAHVNGDPTYESERCLSVVDGVGRMIPLDIGRARQVGVLADVMVDGRPHHRRVTHPTAGVKVNMLLNGFDARLVQHEVDHLDGITILDRAWPVMSRQQRRSLSRKLPAGVVLP